MQRFTLQPLRTRRMFVSVTETPGPSSPAHGPSDATRQTIGAIGALWVSFAASAAGERRPAVASRAAARLSIV